MPDQAHSQTDVWHDRGWLMANLISGNHQMRKAAEIALNQLNVDQAMQQRNDALGIRQDTANATLDQRQSAIDQHQMNFEADFRRKLAHDASSEAYRQLTHDRDTEIDEQGHGLLTGMMKLDAGLRRGQITKDQYDDGLLGLGQQYPLGLRHPEAAKHYDFAITEADKQNAFNARRELTQVAKLGARYGIDPQFDPDTGRPSIALTQQAALQTPRGRNEALGNLNKEMSQKYGITTGVGSLFNPVQPHTSDDNGATINLPFVDQKTGQVGKLPVPAPLFNQMKSDFNDRYFSLNPPQQTAGAVTPTSQAAPAASQIPEVTSPEHYQSLAPGTRFMSGGKLFQKPAEQPVPVDQPVDQGQ